MSFKYARNSNHAPKYNIFEKNNSSENFKKSYNKNKNATLSSFSTQLKNIEMIDKAKTLEILDQYNPLNRKYNNINRNLKYFAPNKQLANNNTILKNNYFNNKNKNDESSIDNEFFEITDMSNTKCFSNLEKINSESFAIIKIITNNNTTEIKKHNMELKENVKFLLKQIKKYQKNGMSIEDNSMTERLKNENQKLKLFYENQIIKLKKEINLYKNKLKLIIKNFSEKNNHTINDQIQELLKENKELKNFINNILSQLNIKNWNNQNEMNAIKINEENIKNCEINDEIKLKNKYKTSKEKIEKIEDDTQLSEFYDIRAFDEKSFENNLFNNIYDKPINYNSFRSFRSNNNILNNIENYKFFGNGDMKKTKSEGKLYKRKNIKNGILFANNNINKLCNQNK